MYNLQVIWVFYITADIIKQASEDNFPGTSYAFLSGFVCDNFLCVCNIPTTWSHESRHPYMCFRTQ